jgi:hypothetical protein
MRAVRWHIRDDVRLDDIPVPQPTESGGLTKRILVPGWP